MNGERAVFSTFFLFLILHCASTPSAAFTGWGVQDINAILAKGQALFDSRKVAEAEAVYTTAIEQDPNSAEAYRRRGICRIELKKYQEAIEDFTNCLRLNPEEGRAYVGRGTARRTGLKDYEGALADYTAAIELNPVHHSAHYSRGILKIDMGDLEGATVDCSRSVTINPGYAPGYVCLGNILARAKEYERAIPFYDRAIELDSKSHIHFYNRAEMYRLLGRAPAAVADYQKALDLNPGREDARKRIQELSGRAGVDPTRSPERQPPLERGRSTAVTPAPTPAAVPVSAPVRMPTLPNVPRDVVPTELTQPLQVNRLTINKYNAMVGAAMEAMRLVQGNISPEETKKFEAKWNPLFDFPTAEGIDYFNKLNPLLVEFLSLREMICQATEEFDAALEEATLSAGYGFADGSVEAMAIAEQQSVLLKNLKARLDAVVKAIQALGDPPNPLAGRRRRQKEHDAAITSLNEMVGRLAREPAAPTGWRYTLKEVKREGVAGRSSIATWKDEDGMMHAELDVKSYVGQAHGVVHGTWTSPPKSFRKGDTIRLACTMTETWKPLQAGRNMPYRILPKIVMSDDQLIRCGCVPAEPNPYGISAPPDETAASPAAQFEIEAERPTMTFTVLAYLGSNQNEREMDYPGAYGAVRYTYIYAGSSAEAVTQAPPKIAPPPTKDEIAAREAYEKAKQEAIAFHQENIRFLEQNLQKDIDEFGREKDPSSARAAMLDFRIRAGKAEIQAEKDLIASYQTGEIVRTRSEWDDYVRDKFIAGIYADRARMDVFQRGAADLQRLASLFSPDEADTVREFIARQLTPSVMAKGDVEKVEQMRVALVSKLQGYYQQGVAQKEMSDAERAIFWLGAAEKAGAVAAFVIGGNTLASFYAGATGYISGGVYDGVKGAASWLSAPTYYAAEAMDGYFKGGYLSGAGVGGAVEKTVVAVGLNKLFEWGINKLGLGSNALSDPKNLGKERPGVSGKEFGAKDIQRFKREMAQGEQIAKELQELDNQLVKAVADKRPTQEILVLREQTMEKAKELSGSFCAKLYAKGAKGQLEKTAIKWTNQIKNEVDREFRALLKSEGWDVSRLPLKDMRNARSSGSLGMDRDYGVSAADLRPGSLIKNGKPASLSSLQTDGSKLYNLAYHKVTGRSADKALHTFTTPIHKESFGDLGVLNDLTVPGNMAKLQRAWGEQTGWTVYLKGKEMLDPKHLQSIGLSKVAGYMESGRGLAKELETKIIPFIQQAKGTNPAAATSMSNHYKGLLNILERFRKPGDSIDPIELSRTIRAYTGGKDLPEILEDLRFATEVLFKFGGVGG